MINSILSLLKAFLEFPKALLSIVNLFRKTPQEKSEDILKENQNEAKQFEESGRPQW